MYIGYGFLIEDWNGRVKPAIEELPSESKDLIKQAKTCCDLYCQGFVWDEVSLDNFHETELGKLLDDAVERLEKVDFYELALDGRVKNIKVINDLKFLELPLD